MVRFQTPNDQDRLVKTKKEVLDNLKTLEKYRHSKNEDERDFYRKRIKLGVGFVVTGEGETYRCGPSRFVGYLKNNEPAHISQYRNGGKSDKCLEIVLERNWEYSKDEEELFIQFCHKLGITPSKNKRRYIRLDSLPPAPPRLKSSIKKTRKADIADIEARTDITSTFKEELIKARRGQGKFRAGVLNIFKDRCAISGCTLKQILRASHMKPWAICSDKERLDPYNGLLLAPNADALFDKGLISFKNNGKIIFSSSLDEKEAGKLGITTNYCVKFSSKHLNYIKYHRSKVFQE